MGWNNKTKSQFLVFNFYSFLLGIYISFKNEIVVHSKSYRYCFYFMQDLKNSGVRTPHLTQMDSQYISYFIYKNLFEKNKEASRGAGISADSRV